MALTKSWWQEGARQINDSDLTEEIGNILRNEKYIYGDNMNDRINLWRTLHVRLRI